jgi:hypothetical protein
VPLQNAKSAIGYPSLTPADHRYFRGDIKTGCFQCGAEFLEAFRHEKSVRYLWLSGKMPAMIARLPVEQARKAGLCG